MLGYAYVFSAKYAVNVHSRTSATAYCASYGPVACSQIANSKHRRFQEAEELSSFPDFCVCVKLDMM